MKEAGIKSQAELARLASIQPNTLTRWIQGVTTPRKNDLDAVCRILRVEAEWLLFGTGPKAAAIAAETSNPYQAEDDLTPYQRIVLRLIRAEIAQLSDHDLETWFERYQASKQKAGS